MAEGKWLGRWATPVWDEGRGEEEGVAGGYVCVVCAIFGEWCGPLGYRPIEGTLWNQGNLELVTRRSPYSFAFWITEWQFQGLQWPKRLWTENWWPYSHQSVNTLLWKVLVSLLLATFIVKTDLIVKYLFFIKTFIVRHILLTRLQGAELMTQFC